MTTREQLIQEIAQAPDFLVEEVLDFMLFAKARRSQQALLETKKELRPFALCAGEFSVPPNFNDPLPEDILRDFEGNF
ncbi:DUF2281 domain-containing protein [Iningainema tapete]|uniref:DUF2281 domain-containing protein n=1 Tax=Iningainema tapete BLCC-T55 TaxID=2748662 RepID=A0A8J7CAV6_9CYAN|nr:DUF2281 domain-containing protein [Iningainema tapete]MBD2777601.1 DUF2281 domain-containing protein [Iningainema tapete BLCC-T55]